MDKEMILKARKANIETYLKGKGETLLREGRQYRVKKHSGLFVSENKWYSHVLSKGGNTLDYLVEVEGIDFKRAVEILLQLNLYIDLPNKPTGIKTVSIPERNQNDKMVLAYLVKTRSIKAEIIIPLLKQGRIYESIDTHNCVFTGVDENNKIRYTMQRSTIPDSSMKFESEGSDKSYSFSLVGKSDIVCIFESPIDLLSYIVIRNDTMKLKPHMLSLGGVTKVALDAYLERTPDIRKLVFCLDNDKAGNEAYELHSKKYSEMGFRTYRHLPEGKDWNEQLLISKSI